MRFTACCTVLALYCLLLTSRFCDAKKGGKASVVDPEIVNPDPNAPKGTEDELEGSLNDGDQGSDRNALSDKNSLWTDAKVPYIFDKTVRDKPKPCSQMDFMWGNCEHGGPSMQEAVKEAMKEFEKFTCIRFVERASEKDYIQFTSKDSGCSSQLGKKGGRQWLNLNDPACKVRGYIMHEIMHALGFDHEQSRNDRDDYITIDWDNISRGNEGQFKKMASGTENNLGSKYDYSSIMHYGEFAFSKDRKRLRTILAKESGKQKVIGQRSGFSKTDISKINKLYNCQ